MGLSHDHVDLLERDQAVLLGLLDLACAMELREEFSECVIE